MIFCDLLGFSIILWNLCSFFIGWLRLVIGFCR